MVKPNRKIRNHLSVVYLIGTSLDGPIKVGTSTNVQTRLEQLQTANWQPLFCYGFFVALPNCPAIGFKTMKDAFSAGSSQLEKFVHKEMRKNELSLIGEWLDLTAREAVQVLKKCASMNDQEVVSLMNVAGVDVVSGDIRVIRARTNIVRELAQLSIFVSESNERSLKLSQRGVDDNMWL